MVPEELLKTVTEVITSYKEAREANEQKVQDPKMFFRFQKDEVGTTKADIVKEIFKVMAMDSHTLWGGYWPAWPRFPPTSMAGLSPAGVQGFYKSEAVCSFDNVPTGAEWSKSIPVRNTAEPIA